MGSTPIYGLPYPDPSSLVQNIDEDFEALALALETVVDALDDPTSVFATSPTWRAPLPQANAATASGALGQQIMWPIVIPEPLSLDGFAFNVRTAGVGGSPTVNVVLYADNGSFFPGGAALADSGAIAVTSTGLKSTTFSPVVLSKGVYWLGTLEEAGTTVAALDRASNVTVPWQTMPLGTGAAPAGYAQGNDGVVVSVASGLSSPSLVGAAYRTNSNAPNYPRWVGMRVDAV